MRRRQIATAVAAVPLVLAGCGDPEAVSNASPLEAIYQPFSPAEQRAKELEVQEVMAQCMREAGWEYIPVDYTAQFNDQAYEDPTEEGYGEKYGYGLVRSYELNEWPNLDEDGNWVGDGGFGGGFEDPNSDYVNSLSPDEMNEYYAAMSGDPSIYQSEIDPVTGEEIFAMPSLEEQGCSGKAQLEVYGEQPWNDQDLNDRLTTLQEDLENDPALQDAEVVWSDCMYEIDPEYDFFGPGDTFQYIDRLMNEAKGLETMPADPETGMVEGGDGTEQVYMTTVTEDGEGIAYVGQPKKLTEAQIRDLQEIEVALWKADQQCLDESGYQELRREREQEIADIIFEEFPQFAEGRNGAAG